MIIELPVSLFESPASCLVNPVNCYGRMGKGLALQFKRKYPGIMTNYVRACTSRHGILGQGALRPGMILPYYAPDSQLVLNVATKDHWSAPSKLEWIEAILDRILANAERLGLVSIALPALGCGEGGLSWEHQVRPMMYAKFEFADPHSMMVVLCLPSQ